MHLIASVCLPVRLFALSRLNRFAEYSKQQKEIAHGTVASYDTYSYYIHPRIRDKLGYHLVHNRTEVWQFAVN